MFELFLYSDILKQYFLVIIDFDQTGFHGMTPSGTSTAKVSHKNKCECLAYIGGLYCLVGIIWDYHASLWEPIFKKITKQYTGKDIDCFVACVSLPNSFREGKRVSLHDLGNIVGRS